MLQKSFFENRSEHSSGRLAHGGSESRGRRKLYRPVNPRKPLHLVLKSSHAKGRMSFLGAKNRLEIVTVFRRQAEKFRITIQGFENMGNHLHLLISIKTRREFQAFLRVVTGLIARFVTGARRGRAFGKRFWDHLAFTRVVSGRRDAAGLTKYFKKNQIERDCGPALRAAVELYDEITRQSKLRRVSRDVILREMLDAADSRVERPR